MEMHCDFKGQGMKISQKTAVAFVLAGLVGYSNVAMAIEGRVYKAKRADIAAQEKYAQLLENLKNVEIWAALGSAREGGVAKSLQAYQKLMEIYSPLIQENGEATVPIYTIDNLELKDLDGFRKFAIRAGYDKTIVADDNTCSAAVTFVFPRQVANVLSDMRPAYVYGGVQSQQQIADARSVRIDKGLDDLTYVQTLCANQKDRSFDNGYINFAENLKADLKKVLPVVDQNYQASVAKPSAPPVSSTTVKRPFDLPKAAKFASCSGLVVAVNQFLLANGKPENQALTDGGLAMIYAGIVYSNVDYMLENSQAWTDKYAPEISSNPGDVQSWMQPKMQDCIATYRANLPEMKPYSDEARAEFFAKAKSLTHQ